MSDIHPIAGRVRRACNCIKRHLDNRDIYVSEIHETMRSLKLSKVMQQNLKVEGRRSSKVLRFGRSCNLNFKLNGKQDLRHLRTVVLLLHIV